MSERAPGSRSERTQNARRWIALGAGGVALGIGLSVLDLERLGALVTVGSLVALLAGVHRFGRAGMDTPAERRRRGRER